MATCLNLMVKKISFVTVFIFICTISFGQDTLKLMAKFNHFFVNNEYKPRGYTLFGATETIGFELQQNRLRYFVGINAVQFYGSNDSLPIWPVIQLSYHFTKKTKLLFGDLNLDETANLPFLFYNYENKYTAAPENGFGLFYNSKSLKSSTFINWRRFIFDGDPFQEQLYFASTLIPRVVFGSIAFSLPSTVSAYHYGGQIDNTSLGAQTLYNFATELRLVQNNAFGINAALLYSSNDFNMAKGMSYIIGAKHNNKLANVWVSYLQLKNWFHPMSEDFFLSSKMADSFGHEKNLIQISLKRNFLLHSRLQLNMATNLYYDLSEKKVDYNLSFIFAGKIERVFTSVKEL